MPHYVSQYRGSGTERDPCRPVGSEQPGWSAIDLRPPGAVAGNCVLYLPLADPNPSLYQICDQKGEDVPALVRAGMAARLSATINYARFDDLVADLLLRPPSNAWRAMPVNPVAPLEIYLGGKLTPNPLMRALLSSFLEDWACADSASLDCKLSWVETNGTGWELKTNKGHVQGNVGTCIALAQVNTATSDQVVTATLSAFANGGGSNYTALLWRVTLNSLADLYRLYAVNDNIAPYWELSKRVSNVTTVLATDATDPAAGDTMEGSAVGSTIQAKFNNTVVGPVTDTSVPTGTGGGLWAYLDVAGASTDLQNWRLRDFYVSRLLRREPMAHMLVR